MTVIADRLHFMENSPPLVDLGNFKSLVAENFIFRAQLVHLQNRPDIADLLYSHVPPTYTINDPEYVVQVCYNIACDALESSQIELAITWYERAAIRTDECNMHGQPRKHGFDNLELLVRHSLVRAYLSVGTPDAKHRLAVQLHILKEKFGANPAVVFLQLEVIRPSNNEEIAEFFKVLGWVFTGLDYTEQSFELGLHYLKYGESISDDHALQTYQQLLFTVPLDRTDWIERAFIALTDLALVISLSEATKMQIILDAATILNKRGFEMLSEAAVHVVFAYIWKHLRSGFEDRCPEAQRWCLFALNTEFFASCSLTNQIQVTKKFVTFSLDCNDLSAAAEGLKLIPLHSIIDTQGKLRNEFQILFLQYRFALQDCKNDEPNCICHQLIQKYPPAGHPQKLQFIQVCIMEAQRLDKSAEVLKGIHEFLEEAKGVTYPETSGVEILPREEMLFLIYVLSNEVDKGNIGVRIVELMASHITLAAFVMRHSAYEDYEDSERKWILEKCYALVCILLENSRLDMTEPLLHTLKELIPFFQDREQLEAEKMVLDVIAPRYPLLVLIRDVCRARHMEHSAVNNSRLWEKVRNGLLDLRNSRVFPELDNKFEGLLWGLCFEACLCQQEWDMALWAFHNSKQCDDGHLRSQYMEAILAKKMPPKHKIWVVREIVSQLYSGNDFEFSVPSPALTDFPIYLQILFRLCITAQDDTETIPWELEFYDDDNLENIWGKAGSHQMSYLQIAESVLDQVIAISYDQEEMDSPDHMQKHQHLELKTGKILHSKCEHYAYPPEQLEALAMLSFNRAMDFYAEGKDEISQSWTKKSIQLARLMGNDEGKQLVDLFEERVRGL
ncbi:Meiosis specific protein SPO22 [Penicillium odoratum]|uniref:Meiosis specific protein SPO22 n=1 Tax=Penicillium odoratum TaxID=1167516 RepID=UPI0025480DD5|nr:Meiosis specific protein SPO22 [Penicillium odoratum]KAJ5758559.1 Meiosis specific protein SPO22 [Penicillium odoratum]